MKNKDKAKRPKTTKVMNIISSILLLLVVLITGAATYFKGVLDVYAGRGELVESQKPGTEDWDTDYYTIDQSSAEEIDSAAKDLTKEIAGEGMTLLKNNGILPLKTSVTGDTDKNITLFGRRSVNTVWGGTGSGAGDAKQCTLLVDALENAGYKVNSKVSDMYKNNLDKVQVAFNTMDNEKTATYYIGEFPKEYYTSDITSTYDQYKDAAVVVIGREGGEGMDFSTDLKRDVESAESDMSADVPETKNYEDGQHQLELSKEEKDLLAHAKENFDNVIVLINSANVMELGELEADENVDAIVWMAYPGSRGTDALADILNGSINPSGHTVDTWPTDLTKDPTFNNTLPIAYENVSASNALAATYSVEYEEGIYVGYRYYETLFAEEANLIPSEGTAVDNSMFSKEYRDTVVYPFGYGLSYASFSQSIKDVKEENGNITVTVTVTNTQQTGGYAGKDVVQVYYNAPYGDEVNNGSTLEKANVVLVGYTKTATLQPGESADYEVTFAVEDMASYDYKTEQSYVLDPGKYTISVRKNAHQIYGIDCTYDYQVSDKVVFGVDNPRQTEIEAQTADVVNLSEEAKKSLKVTAATNQFEEVNAHFVEANDATANKGFAVNLSRTDFAGTWPTVPTKEDLTATDEMIAKFGQYKPDYYNTEDVMPETGASNGVFAAALRGKTYDDPMWDLLLDELTIAEMTKLIYSGNQGTVAVNSINLPVSSATDGPAGLKQYGGLGLGVSGNFNACGTLVAATWNVDLAEAYGVMVGNEAVIAGVDGWYAPGADMHRTAFGGRNFEYYSEDPLISGKTCAATIQGASSKGLTCYFKHFALNDIETHRTDNGPSVWANEQAMREIYLKAFEIAITEPVTEMKYLDKNGETQVKTMRSALGIMSSFNRIGSEWTGGSDSLLKNVLRDEWGFLGTVVTDYNGSKFMNVEEGVSSGNDLMLANESTLLTKISDTSNPSTVKAMRQACKNIIYTHVNSNTVNHLSDSTVISYGISPWKLLLIGIDIALILIAAGLYAVGRRVAKKQLNQF